MALTNFRQQVPAQHVRIATVTIYAVFEMMEHQKVQRTNLDS